MNKTLLFSRPMRKAYILVFSTVCVLNFTTSGQLTQNNSSQTSTWQLNTITTAVPFLQITPDSRSGAMGDAGVALPADANATFWGPAKLSFSKEKSEVSFSYSPWLRALVNDMSLAYLSGYKKVSKNQAIGASLRYFTLGNITFTDEVGTNIMDFKPNEFAIDACFGQKFSESFSGGIAIRYIYSNLTGGQTVLGADSKPGMAIASDISLFYSKENISLGKKGGIFNVGMSATNIGNKIRYTNSDKRDFIPANLRLGTYLGAQLDKYNLLGFTVDFNKLLVPSPPKYSADGEKIIAGKDNNVGVATAIVQSFTDAPGQLDDNNQVIAGSVLREELREINIASGFEYWYDKQFAFRTGYFYEHFSKGNRQFITLGAGLKYQVLTIDMSYLISTTQQNPLANTLRFTMRFTLGAKKITEEETPSSD